jgi:hypothetical protein
MLSDEDLAAWAALTDAATPGPWFASGGPWRTEGLVYAGHADPHYGTCVADCMEPQYIELESERIEDSNCLNDAAFIAAARTALPALLAEVARLRARWEQRPLELPAGRRVVGAPRYR